MYQSLEPEPEGAICPKRSMPQALFSSPHDTLPVCLLAGIIHTRHCSSDGTDRKGQALPPEIGRRPPQGTTVALSADRPLVRVADRT